MEPIKKTGATPTIVGGLGGGEVRGMAEVRTYLVRYVDGASGQEEVTKVDVYGNGDVYVEDIHRVLRKAQGWFRDAILARIQSGGDQVKTVEGALQKWEDEKRRDAVQREHEAALTAEALSRSNS
jgi:hypothetical protein